jgi:hypothetical protein
MGLVGHWLLNGPFFAGSGLCFAGLEVVRVLSIVEWIPIQTDR